MDLTRAAGRAARGTACSLLVLALAATASAGDSPRGADTAVDAEFARFLTGFRRALAQDDRAALVSLTALPFQYEGADLDAAAFRRVVPELFPPVVRRCLATARPMLEDERYVIFCTPYAFYFGRLDEGFRLLEFMADGEALEE